MPAEMNPDRGVHTDEDWKAQARREKERLAQQEQAAAAPAGQAAAKAETAAKPGTTPEHRERPELPPADFLTLVNSLVMQTLLALGLFRTDETQADAQVDLPLAKFHIDTLAMLDEKTAGNLTDNEKRALSLALHDLRMRYINAAS